MKIITFCATKGGVGKTTLTYNLAYWLENKGNKLLLIDSDHQGSLSQCFDQYLTEGTLEDIFTKDNPKVNIISVDDNIDLITSSFFLEEVNSDLQRKDNRNYLMFLWFQDNLEKIKEYDYVIIDCHPDFSTITKNMILISDYVISPIEPSEFGFNAKDKLLIHLKDFKSEAIDIRTRESYVTAKLLYVANRVKKKTKSSINFINAISQEENLVATIPEKELFNVSTLEHIPLVKLKNDTRYKYKNKDFFENIDNIFNNILEAISN